MDSTVRQMEFAVDSTKDADRSESSALKGPSEPDTTSRQDDLIENDECNSHSTVDCSVSTSADEDQEYELLLPLFARHWTRMSHQDLAQLEEQSMGHQSTDAHGRSVRDQQVSTESISDKACHFVMNSSSCPSSDVIRTAHQDITSSVDFPHITPTSSCDSRSSSPFAEIYTHGSASSHKRSSQSTILNHQQHLEWPASVKRSSLQQQQPVKQHALNGAMQFVSAHTMSGIPEVKSGESFDQGRSSFISDGNSTNGITSTRSGSHVIGCQQTLSTTENKAVLVGDKQSPSSLLSTRHCMESSSSSPLPPLTTTVAAARQLPIGDCAIRQTSLTDQSLPGHQSITIRSHSVSSNSSGQNNSFSSSPQSIRIGSVEQQNKEEEEEEGNSNMNPSADRPRISYQLHFVGSPGANLAATAATRAAASRSTSGYISNSFEQQAAPSILSIAPYQRHSSLDISAQPSSAFPHAAAPSSQQQRYSQQYIMMTNENFFKDQQQHGLRRSIPTSSTASAAVAMNNVPTTVKPLHRKRSRTFLSPEQSRVLYQVLEQTCFPSRELREEIAAKISVTPRSVQVWFQNQRQKVRSKLAKDKQQQHQTGGEDSSSNSSSPKSAANAAVGSSKCSTEDGSTAARSTPPAGQYFVKRMTNLSAPVDESVPTTAPVFTHITPPKQQQQHPIIVNRKLPISAMSNGQLSSLPSWNTATGSSVGVQQPLSYGSNHSAVMSKNTSNLQQIKYGPHMLMGGATSDANTPRYMMAIPANPPSTASRLGNTLPAMQSKTQLAASNGAGDNVYLPPINEVEVDSSMGSLLQAVGCAQDLPVNKTARGGSHHSFG